MNVHRDVLERLARLDVPYLITGSDVLAAEIGLTGRPRAISAG